MTSAFDPRLLQAADLDRIDPARSTALDGAAARAIAQAFIPGGVILGAELAHWRHGDSIDGPCWLFALDPSAGGPPTVGIPLILSETPVHLARPTYLFVLVDAEDGRPLCALTGHAAVPGDQGS